MQVNIKGKLSSYIYVPARISQLKSTRRQLAKRYWDMYDDHLTYNKNIDQTTFNKIVKDINDIEAEIDQLSYQLQDTNMTNSIIDTTTGEETSALAFVKKRSERIPEELFRWKHKWLQTTTPSTPTTIDVTIEQSPKKKIPKKKTDNKKLTTDKKEEITSNIKELLAKNFPFKDKPQCVSKQRSQPYYASKEEILEKIEKDPELKKLVPANYKKLTKDKLCEVFFGIQNGGQQ